MHEFSHFCHSSSFPHLVWGRGRMREELDGVLANAEPTHRKQARSLWMPSNISVQRNRVFCIKKVHSTESSRLHVW